MVRKYPQDHSQTWQADYPGCTVQWQAPPKTKTCTCWSARGRQLHASTYENQSFSYGSASNWANGIPQALIKMGGQPSYWAVTGKLPRPPALFCSVGADIIFSEF